MFGYIPTIRLAGAVAVLALALPFASHPAQAAARSGKQVVQQVCAACHASGAHGAPRIGDEKAWSARAAQGLASLTRHAIQGIRKMPAHGGNPGVSDYEIELAITYMVNRSGGHWAVPIDKSAPPVARSGKQIVQEQCVKCHGTGVGGAPRIGDRKAWIARAKQGLDVVVRSAIQGHGGMPARGGLANLSDEEIRSAVIYMLNQGIVPAKSQETGQAASAPQAGGDYRLADGTKIYLGIISAAALREQHPKPGSTEASMHGGIPSGNDYYHLSVSLFDSKTGARITDAKVKATVSDPLMGGDTKPLHPTAIGSAVSYGNYFRIADANPHTVTVHVVRPGSPQTITAKFDFRR